MFNFCGLFYLLSFINLVFMQGIGSGTNGKLRLCVVEGRGEYKRAPKFCPILDRENADVECALGTDRLDCLRRISKGTVDFGVFSPEDLIAAQWADIDVLVTNEMRLRNRPFQRRIVAVVNRRILPDTSSTLHAVLQNSTLCHPGVGIDDIRPLSDTMSAYLETLVLVKSCDAKLSLVENRVKAMAGFFGAACKAGPWLPDPDRDAELKSKYSSLCSACRHPFTCAANDPYWGSTGALACLGEGAGDVAWAEIDDINSYFGINPRRRTVFNTYSSITNWVYLCRDGTWQPLENNTDPCVWLNRPWDVIVSKRKAASAVAKLMAMQKDSSSNDSWRSALDSLLETGLGSPTPLKPPQPPLDYLGRAKGFREAYTQRGCGTPRHITLCTTSLLAKNKCEWLSEAGAVYGLAPPLQCIARNSTEQCMASIKRGEADVTVADSEHLVPAVRDYNLSPILHEATPIIEKTHTVVAYVKRGSGISSISDLKGKRAAFPRYDGVAWHGVREYFMRKEKMSCMSFENYFDEICAPGVTASSPNIKPCYPEGEVEALNSLVVGKSDVAFISMNTFNMIVGGNKNGSKEEFKNLIPICPDENKMYCFITWSNIGHLFVSNKATQMRKQEIINVFTKMDQMFGKHPVFQYPMFSLYGPYNHKMNVIFHNNTKILAQNRMFFSHPYNKLPLNFEQQILNVTDFACDFSGKTTPSLILIVSLVSVLVKYF